MPLFIDINIGSRVPIRPDRGLKELHIPGITHKEIFLQFIPDAVESHIDGYISKAEAIDNIEYWLLMAEEIDDLATAPVDRGDGGGG